MIAKQRKTLSCLYFPYADPKPTQNLLTASLLYDKIYYLELNFFRKPIQLSEHTQERKLDPSLRQIGIFEEIGPSLIGINPKIRNTGGIIDRNVAREIQASIATDISSIELQHLAKNYRKVSWYIPNGQYLYWNALGIIFDFTTSVDGNLVPEIFTSRKEFYEDFAKRSGYIASVHSYDELRIRNAPTELMVRLPFLAAESLMITVALHACRELELIPFTDSSIHDVFLRTKMKAIQKKLFTAENALPSLKEGISYTDIGNASIGFSIPHISDLTPEKVIYLREKCKDQLEQFRYYLRKLSYEVEAQPWEADYEYEIRKIVDTQIQPSLVDLTSKLNSLKSELKFSLVEKTLVTTPFPFMFNIVTGVPIEWLLPAGLGLVWLNEVLHYYKNRSDLKKNGISFLLNLGDS